MIVVAAAAAHMSGMSQKPKAKQLSGQVVIFVIGTFSLVIDSAQSCQPNFAHNQKLIKFCTGNTNISR